MGNREIIKTCLIAFVLIVANATLVKKNDEFLEEQSDTPRKRRRGLSIISNLLNDMGFDEVRNGNMLRLS